MGENPFAESTAYGMLATVARRHATREAMVFGDERVTFADFRARVDALADGLTALGLGPGDALAIWLPNRPLWFVAQYAAASLGIVVVALNPRYRAHELRYILKQSDATALLLTDHLGAIDYFETLHEVLPELSSATPGELASAAAPRLRHVIVDADDPYPGCLGISDVLSVAHALAGGRQGDGGEASRANAVLSEEAAPPSPSRPAADDVFTLLYTSGTTAFPKGAMITHRNCVPHGWHCGEQLRLTPDDRVLHAMPAPGTWGGLNIPLSAWSHGACLVLMEAWDPLRALGLIERERCTVFNAVDTMLKPLFEHPDFDRYDHSSLRTGAFASVGGGGPAMLEAVVKRLGVPYAFQPYGMTEVNALALLHDLDEPLELRLQPGSRPAPGLEVRIVHPDTGARCAPGQAGELQFRGALVTRGYYNKPDETRAAFTGDGWFRTGDLASQDAAGHTVFMGRLKETLRISHFMVAPGEIEAFLQTHPDVDQAFVVGVPDPELNEAPVAYVITKPSARLTEAELRAFCRGQIASYKIPRVVRFVADVPRTPGPHGDKVQRGKLREQAIQEVGR
ncbi:MAG TPA: AMP-binding protein [Methylomirabilota bacterium]|nr:AMP-binding protein [Methylomirabilota bacterium]